MVSVVVVIIIDVGIIVFIDIVFYFNSQKQKYATIFALLMLYNFSSTSADNCTALIIF